MTRNSDATASNPPLELGADPIADIKFAAAMAESVRQQIGSGTLPSVAEIQEEIRRFDERQKEIWKDNIVEDDS